MEPRTQGALEMTVAMTISGTVGWFVVQSGQAPTSAVFWRCLFGALAMLVVCMVLGQLRRAIVNGRQVALILLGGLTLVLNWGLLFGAYSHASISIATVIYHTQPFMLVALGLVLFGERLTREKMGWLTLSFGGLIAIVVGRSNIEHSGDSFLLGVTMALGAAFFYAATAIIAKGLKGVPPHLIVLGQLTIGSIVLLPFSQNPTDIQSLGILVAIGVVHTGLMTTLLYGAIQKISTSLVGILSFIYPVVAIVVDWIAFGQHMNFIQVTGALVILTSAIRMNRVRFS